MIDYKQAERDKARRMQAGSREFESYLTRPFTPHNGYKGGLEFGLEKIINFCALLRTLPLSDGAEILDVGVGGGWTSDWLAQWGFHVTAVDIAFEHMVIAQRRATDLGNKFFYITQADAEMLPFASESFDAVLFYDALHHCPSYNSALKESFRVLRCGGWFAASEPTLAHKSKHQDYTLETGIHEGGFDPLALRQELLQLGFRRCYLRTKPYLHYAYRPPRPLERAGLKLAGLSLDFFLRLISPITFFIELYRYGFQVSAQK